MRPLLFTIIFLCLCLALQAQKLSTYVITADSVKLTSCDSSELIIENHTQNIPGFLFNRGRGRTVFQRALLPIGSGSFLIGADTLNLGVNAWLQGGNRFGTTGVLGTLDNNSLDLYTNDSLRVRLTNAGHLLLGTTADSGNLLQVHGNASVSGNLNIGTSTITNTGSLIGTNAILYNHYISLNHNFTNQDPYLGQLNNILFGWGNRIDSTVVNNADGSQTTDILFPPYELSAGYDGLVYPSGIMYFAFWSNGPAQSVSIMLKDKYGNWWGPYSSSTNLALSPFAVFQVPINTSATFIDEIKYTCVPVSGGGINLVDVEYVPSTGVQGLVSTYPYVSKVDPSNREYMYYPLGFRNSGSTRISLSPLNYSYFLNNVLIGDSLTSDNNTSLQIANNLTGGEYTAALKISQNWNTLAAPTVFQMNVTNTASGAGALLMDLQVNGTSKFSFGADGSLRTFGSVRFAGLTQDSTKTNVLVSDANGNLYYRSASSLAGDDLIRSSLAVNGPMTAKKLTLTGGSQWPDYVFDSTYRLPALCDVDTYIKKEHHLPGIPAAAVIGEQGLDVGANQAALLKKIEELTLYNIDQAKKLDEQSKKLESQDQQLTALKAEVDELKTLIKGKNLE